MKIVYLMGAGRSGTTLVTTLLGNANGIIAIGEMHQFLEYVLDNKPCSCGQELANCEFWAPVIKSLLAGYSREELLNYQQLSAKVESHTYILKSLVSQHKKYTEFTQDVFNKIATIYGPITYVDSSKYISRGLQLSKKFGANLKLVYMVRDVRGVINSFKKNVQTSKSALGSIVYYWGINSFGLLVAMLYGKKRVFKFRYEDLIANPERTLTSLGSFLEVPLTAVQNKLTNDTPFVMPHIIAGNRMRSQQQIRLKPDLAWKNAQGRGKQILYYLATLPLQLINKYKV